MRTYFGRGDCRACRGDVALDEASGNATCTQCGQRLWEEAPVDDDGSPRRPKGLDWREGGRPGTYRARVPVGNRIAGLLAFGVIAALGAMLFKLSSEGPVAAFIGIAVLTLLDYAALVYAVNRVTFDLTEASLALTHGPLPMARRKAYALQNVSHFAPVARLTVGLDGRAEVAHEVHAVLRGGETDAVPGLDFTRRAEAAFISHRLSAALEELRRSAAATPYRVATADSSLLRAAPPSAERDESADDDEDGTESRRTAPGR